MTSFLIHEDKINIITISYNYLLNNKWLGRRHTFIVRMTHIFYQEDFLRKQIPILIISLYYAVTNETKFR